MLAYPFSIGVFSRPHPASFGLYELHILAEAVWPWFRGQYQPSRQQAQHPVSESVIPQEQHEQRYRDGRESHTLQ